MISWNILDSTGLALKVGDSIGTGLLIFEAGGGGSVKYDENSSQ